MIKLTTLIAMIVALSLNVWGQGLTPRVGWTATADSQYTTYAPVNAVSDAGYGWVSGGGGYPHYLNVDMQSLTTCSGLMIFAVNDAAHYLYTWEIYTSADGATWGSPIKSGTWTATPTPHAIMFDSPVTTRYFKIKGLTGADTYMGIRDFDCIKTPNPVLGVDFTPHVLTGNNVPSPYTAAASSHYLSWDAFHAFDGLSMRYFDNSYHAQWLGVSGADWLSIYTGTTAKLLTSYAIEAGMQDFVRAPKNWTMEGSNDGASWTVLDTVVNQSAWARGEGRVFTIASPGSTKYTYFRLNITANNGGGAYTNVNELYLYSTASSYHVTVSKTGSGTVISGDGFINCGATCNYTWPSTPATIVLTATNSDLTGTTLWTGCDSAVGTLCTLNLPTANSTPSVTFMAGGANTPVVFMQ